MFNFFSYLENENIKNEWNIWSERCKDFSKKKDNTEIKTILKELKEGGLYDYK